MKVSELKQKVDKVAEEHPDAEVRVDPPFSRALGAYYNSDENALEISH